MAFIAHQVDDERHRGDKVKFNECVVQTDEVHEKVKESDAEDNKV